MAAATTPSEPAERLSRFSVAERWLHWTTAAVMLTCALTGLVLYVPDLASLVGRRALLKDIHVYAGLLMPLPLLLAYAGRWRTAVRRDIRSLARWSLTDRIWLFSLGRRARDQVGKFNAGQKANAAFIAGLIPVMLATGSIMRWFDPFPLAWRTGATFVHDWTALAAWLIIAGHILVAVSKPPALRSMILGWIPTAWARKHHSAWAREVESAPTEPPTMATLRNEVLLNQELANQEEDVGRPHRGNPVA